MLSGTATADLGPDEPDDRVVDESSWTRAVVVGLTVYLVSRLCVVAGTAVRAAQVTVDARADGEPDPGAGSVISGVLTSWDGRWYLEIVRGGYPDAIPPNITYEQLEARAAFFPLYPWIVRIVDAVLPGGDTFAALFVNFVLGAISVVLVGLLARRLYSVNVAARSMTLYAIFPGSAILSFAYAEALLIVLAAACLIFLLDERWLLAGLAAALATASRPNGIAVVAACVVASALAIRRSRQWWSLVAVLLAPIGFVFFQWFVDRSAGERGAWFRVQREAWSEGTSFGATAVTNTLQFFTSPLSSPTDALTALTMMALVAMTFCAWRVRLPWILVAYAAVVVALMLIPETVTARPRFLFTAFPLFIAVAAWWPERTDTEHHRASWEYLGWDATLVACGAGLATLTGLYAVFGVIP
jgi:4-amino-4-deoxy-L-arabinose transferase-like glycosyltransferase